MRRLARRLFTLCAAVSLLLCVALVVAWVYTHHRCGIVYYSTGERDGGWDRAFRTGVHAEGGGCAFLWEHHLKTERHARWEDERHGVPAWDGRKTDHAYGFPGPPRPTRYPISFSRRASLPERLGFEFRRRFHERPGYRLHDVVVVLPFWSLTTLAAVLPACRLRQRLTSHRKSRRAASGLCASCGYDLRATPGRCPECGAAAAVEKR